MNFIIFYLAYFIVRCFHGVGAPAPVPAHTATDTDVLFTIAPIIIIVVVIYYIHIYCMCSLCCHAVWAMMSARYILVVTRTTTATHLHLQPTHGQRKSTDNNFHLSINTIYYQRAPVIHPMTEKLFTYQALRM